MGDSEISPNKGTVESPHGSARPPSDHDTIASTGTAVGPRPNGHTTSDQDQHQHHDRQRTALTDLDQNSVANHKIVDALEGNSLDTTKSTKRNPKVTKQVTIIESSKDESQNISTNNANLSKGERGAAEIEDHDEDGSDHGETEISTTKKKKKRKPKSKRGLNAPTGFEEYYVDAPLTPGEHQEEQRIYDPSFPFTQRIETAIQRFIAKRKFDAEGTTLFDRYLVYGGIKSGQKMFGGLDPKALDTKNAAEIAEMTATAYVENDKVDAFHSIHVVDFERCLSSFLSAQLPARWDLQTEEKVKYLIGILRNFFNYLLHHDVCPEYQDQINSARALCDKATREIWNMAMLNPLLPGDFNMACSEIFGGMYQGMVSANQEWMVGLDVDCHAGMTPEQARKAFKFGIAANASDKMFPIYSDQLRAKTYRVISTEDVGFEITALIPPDENALNLYGQQQCAGLKSLGKMEAKTWLRPYAQDEDLTEEEERHLAQTPTPTKKYEFWVEEEILDKCIVGMKIEATVRETSFGLTYFDAIHGVHAPFYHLISNELVGDWKEIEKEWLPMRSNKLAANSAHGEQDADPEDAEAQDTQGQEEGSFEESIKEKSEIVDQRINRHAEEADGEFEVNANMIAAGYDEEDEKQPGSKEPMVDGTTQATTGKAFGVEVKKANVEMTKVSCNETPVVQENFDVEPIDENH